VTKEGLLKEDTTCPAHLARPTHDDGRRFIFAPTTRCRLDAQKSDGLPIEPLQDLQHVERYVEGNTGPDGANHVAVIFDKGATPSQ